VTYSRGCGRIKIDISQRLWMNKKRPIPEDIGLFLIIHNLWNRSLFIHPEPLVWSFFIHPQPKKIHIPEVVYE
jgi:hypothetical protein